MKDKRAILVTGGSRGIGQAIATRFGQAGHGVFILARRQETIDKAIEKARTQGWSLNGACVDFSQSPGIASSVEHAVEALGGRLDVLVNNAGIFDMASLERTDEAMWARFMQINLTAPYLVTQAALPALRQGSNGQVINILSVAAKQGFPHNTVYCTSKYGLRGMSDALREELRPDGIRVSSIYPGPTNTQIFDTVDGDWDRSTMNLPEDVAEVAWRAHWEEGDQADLDVAPPVGP